MEQEKFCPLIKGPCIKEKCAWWSASENQCAIVEIAKTVS